MKRPALTPRPSDDATLTADTGRDRAAWFAAIDAAGASGRSAIGRFLQGEKLDPWWVTTLLVDYEAAKGAKEKDGRPKGYSLCVTKTVAAPVGRVWRAFTEGAELGAWFGPDTRIDPQPGGRIENADGNRATLTKVRPDKALVFGWDSADMEAGSQVEVLFQPKGGKTGIVVNHTRVQDRAGADAIRAAWEDALVRLKAHCEG